MKFVERLLLFDGFFVMIKTIGMKLKGMNDMSKGKKCFLVFFVLLFVFGIYIVVYGIIRSHKTISPDKAYKATYNKITHTVNVEHLQSGTDSYLSCDDARFSDFRWSSDGRYLTVTLIDGDECSRMITIDLLNGIGFDGIERNAFENTDEKLF